MEQTETPPSPSIDLDDVADDLDRVDRILGRIAAGRHGRCVTCSVAIDDATLDGDPLAETCAEHGGDTDAIGRGVGDVQTASGSSRESDG